MVNMQKSSKGCKNIKHHQTRKMIKWIIGVTYAVSLLESLCIDNYNIKKYRMFQVLTVNICCITAKLLKTFDEKSLFSIFIKNKNTWNLLFFTSQLNRMYNQTPRDVEN